MPDRKGRGAKQGGQGARPQFQPQPERTSRGRGADRFEQRARFLIVCEGQNTEPDYFDGFRVPGLVVDTVGTGRSTLSLVDEAIRVKEEREARARRTGKPPYDQAWCVFDRDSFPKDAFNDAIRKAEAAGFQVAYSNEASELWYLLHFEDHRSALHRHQYVTKLRGHLGSYEKDKANSRAMYGRLQGRQVQAVKRAESLRAEYGEAHNPQADTPCTTVHLLVRALRANVSPPTLEE